MANTKKRMDKNRTVLKKGESQRENGTYAYRWQTADGKRHTIYAKTLNELCETNVNIKVMQDVLGHKDIQTTMNIYTDATNEFKTRELKTFEQNLKAVM